MVALNPNQPPWTSFPAEIAYRPWRIDAPSLSDAVDVAALSAAFDSQLRSDQQRVSEYRREIAPLEKYYAENRDDPQISDVQSQSDDWLLDNMMKAGFFAERTLDQIEGITEFIATLKSIRDKHNIWSPIGTTLMTELERIREVLIWTEKAARGWVSQFCDEYERRHPDSTKLPFEPLDLGPTNTARLPQVL